MSRSIDRDEEKLEGSGFSDGLSRSGGETRPRAVVAEDSEEDFGENRRITVRIRQRVFSVRPSESRLLNELGRFRVIREEDLKKGVYGGDSRILPGDLRSLREQGLIRSVSVQPLGAEKGIRVQSLTRDGYEVASAHGEPHQRLYWGIVKPSEVEHDSLLYRAFLHEQTRIRQLGGSVTRVVLDYELKGKHFSKVNKPDAIYRLDQLISAKELNLQVVDGRVMFPDVRIEYEDDRGEVGRVDVEVATGNYRGQHMAAKAAAGFRVYAASGAGGARVQSGGSLKSMAPHREDRVVFSL